MESGWLVKQSQSRGHTPGKGPHFREGAQQHLLYLGLTRFNGYHSFKESRLFSAEGIRSKLWQFLNQPQNLELKHIQLLF